jgi:hypothetical protein
MNRLSGVSIDDLFTVIGAASSASQRSGAGGTNADVLIEDKTRITTLAMVGLGVAALSVVGLLIYTKKSK